LLELLGVLVILALIAGLAAPRVMKVLGGAKTKTTRINLEQLSTVLDMRRYPDAYSGLKALLERPGWRLLNGRPQRSRS